MIKLLPGNRNPAVLLPVNHFTGRDTFREKNKRNVNILKLNIGMCVYVFWFCHVM
jgi:hypothetical protein